MININKFAVISDIHGNLEALNSTVTDALNHGAEGFIFLGDYGVGFTDTRNVIKYIRSIQNMYPTYVIKGDADKKLILGCGDYGLEDQMVSMAKSAISYDDEDYISRLPESLSITLPNKKELYLKHIMPIFTQEELSSLNGMTILFGHSHYAGQWIKGNTSMFNPGSAGLIDGGSTGANYGLLEWNSKQSRWNFEVRRVDYDYQTTLSKIKELTTPNDYYDKKLLVKSIEDGYNYLGLYTMELMRLSSKYHCCSDNYIPIYAVDIMIDSIKGRNVSFDGESYMSSEFPNRLVRVDNAPKMPTYIHSMILSDLPKEVWELAYLNVNTYSERLKEKSKDKSLEKVKTKTYN